MEACIGQYAPVFLPGELPSLTEKPGRPQSTGSQRVGHDQSYPVCTGARLFSGLWQFCPRESWAGRWCSCLACGGPGGAKCAGTQTASTAGVMALSQSFFKPLVAGDQKASLASFSSRLCPCRHLGGFLAWGPSLVLRCIRHIEGAPSWGPTL